MAWLPAIKVYGVTSCDITVPSPEKAYLPMWQNWCTRVNPPRDTLDSNFTCPAKL